MKPITEIKKIEENMLEDARGEIELIMLENAREEIEFLRKSNNFLYGLIGRLYQKKHK